MSQATITPARLEGVSHPGLSQKVAGILQGTLRAAPWLVTTQL